MQNRVRVQVCLAALLALGVWLTAGLGPLAAQSTYGTINGTITDASGGLVSGAKVEVLNQGTGITRSMSADAAGNYEFLNLDPGTYTITVSATNFTTTQNKGVVLPARETRTVPFQLQVAGGNTQVAVVASEAVISEDQTRSSSHSGDEINSLALNFRATPSPSPLSNIAPLSAGVQSDSNGNLTISGQLPTATSFSLDGISTQLPRFGGPTKDLFPSVEGIAEFRVNYAGNSAEYSQVSDVTAISRSGSNDYHGTAYWYFQRKDFDSADQITGFVPNGSANTAGAAIGGPVLIPGLYNGKDKTFFYFDYESVRLSSNTTISTNTIPAQWRTGDFSSAGATIIDPTTGSPFPGNMIPTSRIDPIAAKILPQFFPAPTNSSPNLSAFNLVQSFPGTYQSDGYDGRLDHNFTPNHKVWFRVTQK